MAPKPQEGKPAQAVPITSPFAWLEASGRRAPALAAELRRIAAKPVHLVLYSDGVTPGDSFGHMKRKFTAVYFTFLDFGAQTLSRDECWWVAAVVRESLLHSSAAGVSQLYKKVLASFFGRAHRRHDLRDGVTLRFLDGAPDVLLQGDLGVILGDELGLKEAICCKGHAGTHPCALCFNVLLASDARCAPDGPLYPLTSVRVSSFQQHTDASIRGIVDRLRVASRDTSRGHVGRMEKLQKDLGFNFEPEGWLAAADIPTDLISTLMWDWMHIYFVTGVFETEVFWGRMWRCILQGGYLAWEREGQGRGSRPRA